MWEKGKSVRPLKQIVFPFLKFLVISEIVLCSFTCVARGVHGSGSSVCLFGWVLCFFWGVRRSAKEETV